MFSYTSASPRHRRRGRIVSVFSFAALSAILGSAHAEPLTLEQAVELALQRAPQVAAVQSEVDAARARAESAGRLPDPSLVIGIENLPVNGDEAWSVSRDFMTMRQIGVMQDVPNGAKRTAMRSVAQAEVRASEAQQRETELTVAQATAEAWVGLKTAQDLSRTLETLESELSLEVTSTNASLRAARASTLDALAAHDALLALKDRLVTARAEARIARTQLARWIGPDAEHLETSGTPIFSTLTPDQEQALTTLHSHAALVALDAQLDVARAEVDLARAEKKPDWATGLSYSKRGDAFSDMISLEFRIGLPLFSRTRQDPQIRARRAAVSQLEAERDSDARMHAAEISQMLERWRAARERADLIERERLPLAQERTQAAMASYRSAGASLSEVLASVRQEIEIREQHAMIMRELAASWAFLRYLQSR